MADPAAAGTVGEVATLVRASSGTDLSAQLYAVAAARLDARVDEDAAVLVQQLGQRALLAGAVDTVADLVLRLASSSGINPACWASAVLAPSTVWTSLTPPARLIVSTAAELLCAQDPTGEFSSPHPTCRPWPSIEVKAVAEFKGGALLTQASALAAAVSGMGTRPRTALTLGAADALIRLQWCSARDGSTVRAALLSAAGTATS